MTHNEVIVTPDETTAMTDIAITHLVVTTITTDAVTTITTTADTNAVDLIRPTATTTTITIAVDKGAAAIVGTETVLMTTHEATADRRQMKSAPKG